MMIKEHVSKGRMSVIIRTNDADESTIALDDVFTIYEKGSFLICEEGDSLDKTFIFPLNRIKEITTFLKGVK